MESVLGKAGLSPNVLQNPLIANKSPYPQAFEEYHEWHDNYIEITIQ